MNQLIETLGMKFDTTREMLLLGLILARTLPMIFVTPFMAGQIAPPEVKMAVGVLFAILVWPLARDSLPHPVPMFAAEFLLLMLKETLVGFAIGFSSAHLFYAMETAGRFIDTARGAAMSEVLVPTSRSRATPIGTLYHQLLVVFFFALGGHQIFLQTFFFSFASLPLTGGIDLTPGLSPMASYAIHVTGQVMMVATILSAPAIAATFITDLVFGILNRVAPQLNAYFMAMPVKAMGALILILVSLQPFIERLQHFMGDTLESVQQTTLLLQPR